MAINAQFTADFSDYVRGSKQATDALKDVEKASKDAADQSGASLKAMQGFAADLAGAFGIAFSVGAVVAFGQELLTSTAALGDMSAATGIATDDLQKLAYVGEGFGVDLPEISAAVATLSNKLASGDASAAGAVTALGLNIKDLIALGPTEAFLTVADAAGQIEDPMAKAAESSDLFGDKLGKKLVPYLGDLRTKMDEVPKGAIISPETIKSAADFDTALSHLWTRFKAFTAEGVAGTMTEISRMTSVLTQDYSDAGALAAKLNKELNGVATEGLPAATDATKSATAAADLMTNTLNAWRTEGLIPLTAAQKDAIALGIERNKSETEIAHVIGVSTGAVHAFAEAQKQRATDVKAAIADEQKAQIAYADLLDHLHREALKHQQDEAAETQRVLGVRNTATVDAVTKLTAVQEKYRDAQMKASMDATTYQITKIWEKADAEIKAFGQTGQLAEQHADLVYSLAEQEAKGITDVMASAVDQMAGKATAGINQVKDQAQAAVSAMYTMAGGGYKPTAAQYDEYYKTAAGIEDIIRNKGKRYYEGEAMPRASGGPVSAGSPYLVGENGPELFVPSRSGSIVPGGNSTVINITQPLGTASAIARAVEDAMNSALRNSGVRLPSGA